MTEDEYRQVSYEIKQHVLAIVTAVRREFGPGRVSLCGPVLEAVGNLDRMADRLVGIESEE